MTLRNLRVFVTVCQYMNMSMAAKMLYLSPPAVSQIIREMEAHYGVPLFVRQGRNLYLTHAGTILYHNALSVLESADYLEDTMRSETAKPTINLGSTLTVSATFLPPLVAGYQKSCGEADIHIYAYISRTLKTMLLNGSLDFAIIAGNLDIERFEILPFLDDEQIFIAYKDHPILQNYSEPCPTIPLEHIPPIDIFVRDKESTTYTHICTALQDAGIPYQICGVISNIDGIILSVSHNLGIGSVSKYVKIQNPNIRRFRIQGIHVTRTFNLVYLKGRVLPSIYHRLKEYILSFPVEDM